MIAEDIDIIPLSGRHFLPLLHLTDGGGQVAEIAGFFEPHLFGGRFHATV